jgi:hypothetical protein
MHSETGNGLQTSRNEIHWTPKVVLAGLTYLKEARNGSKGPKLDAAVYLCSEHSVYTKLNGHFRLWSVGKRGGSLKFAV